MVLGESKGFDRTVMRNHIIRFDNFMLTLISLSIVDL